MTYNKNEASKYEARRNKRDEEANDNESSNSSRQRVHEGFAEMGRKGGQARAEQLGHDGYVEMGRKGGQARAEQLGHDGYVELGHKGGSKRAEQMAQKSPQKKTNK